MGKVFKKITASVKEFDGEEVTELVQEALDEGIAPGEILKEGLMSAMEDIGEQFKNGEIFVPEVIMASHAMMCGVNILRPLLAGSDEKKGVAVIGTVAGDLHDIGKKIVAMMLEGAGFSVVDLGVDVTAETFVAKVKELDARLVCMSAMLTTTMAYMGTVVQSLKDEGLYDKVRVMVGGAPLTPAFAESIGAHYSYDAASAVDLAKILMEKE